MRWTVCCVVLLMEAVATQAATASSLLAPERRTLTAQAFPGYSIQGGGWGSTVYVGDNLLVVGNSGPVTINGQDIGGDVYVFTRTGITGEWMQAQILVDPLSDTMDNFGDSSATDGHTLLVAAGAASGSLNAFLGTVYVYSQDSVGQWQQIQKLQATDAQSAWFFGSAVALGSDFALIGAPGYRTTSGPRGQGAVYVFTKNSSGQWQQAQEITDPVGGEYDAFGSRIALDGNTALVSASYGLVYVLTRDSAGVWNIAATLNPPVSSPYLTEPYVALQGDDAFVGVVGTAADGTTYIAAISVYRFDTTLGQWQYIQSLDLAAQGAGLIGSTPISVHGTELVVGTGVTISNQYSWAVFRYDQDVTSGLWQLTQRINGQPGDYYSTATVFDGAHWLVNVPSLNPTSQTPGAVLVLGPSIDLSLMGQPDVTSIKLGQWAHIVYTAINHDPALTATNVELALTVDTGATFGAVTGAQCTAGTTPTTLVCDLGNLAPGAMASVTVPVSINYGPGSITTFAQVSADQGDLLPSDNSVSIATLVQQPPSTGGGGDESIVVLVFFAWLLVMNRYLSSKTDTKSTSACNASGNRAT